MFRILRFVPLVALLLTTVGCARNYFNVPNETVNKKVKVLGVAPIFMDADSQILHPEKDALIALVKEFNRKNERELAAMLRKDCGYFSVRFLDDEPDQLFPKLFSRREKRDDAGIQYNKYFFKEQEVRDYLAKNGMDALMLVVVSGITRRDTKFSSNLTAKLEANYDDLVMTAVLLDGSESPLWEYPNFRQRLLSLPPLYELQYPDFDEADANLSDKVDIKYKTVAGIRRGFERKEKDIMFRAMPVSSVYYRLFSDMVALQKR